MIKMDLEQNDILIIERGRGRILLYGGQQYYKHQIYKNGNSHWRCREFKNNSNKCFGTVTLSPVSTYIEMFYLFITFHLVKLILN